MREDDPRPTARSKVAPRRSVLNALVWLIAVGWLAVAVSSLDDSHGWGDDWAQYASQARGLAHGTIQQEVELSRFRNAYSTAPFGPTVAPWGLPLILAPIYAASGGDLSSLKIPSCVFYALFLVTIFLLFEDRIDDVSRLLLVAVFALDPTLFQFQNQLLSDIPFLFYSTFSLLLIDRCILRRRFFFQPVIDLTLLGTIISLACLTRTVGVLLLATVAAAQLIHWISRKPRSFSQHVRERRAEALVYGFAFLGLALAALLLPRVEVPVSPQFAHLRQQGVGEIAANLVDRILNYALVPSEFFRSRAAPPPVQTGLAAFTVAFAMLGAVRRFKQDAVFLVYCGLTLGVLIVIGSFAGLRYCIPLLPFLLYFAVVGLTPRAQTAAGSFWKGWRAWPLGRLFAAVVVALFVAHLAMAFDQAPRQPHPFEPFGADGRAMLAHVVNETEEDAVVVFFKPRAMTYLTGRRSIVVSRFDQLFDGRADYIVLSKARVRDQLPIRAPFWRERRDDYRIVFQNRSYLIVDLRSGPPKGR